MKQIIYKDYTELSVKTAELIAGIISKKPDALLCFPAGETSVGTFKHLIALNKKGKINKFAVITSLLLNQKSVRTSNVLRNTIDKFFPQEIFDELRVLNKEILVGAQNYSQVPSRIHYFSSADIEFEEFKDWMWCSANFPFFTSLVNMSWNNNTGSFHVGQWSNGGISDLIGIDQNLSALTARQVRRCPKKLW